jgi:hypothetical protein
MKASSLFCLLTVSVVTLRAAEAPSVVHFSGGGQCGKTKITITFDFNPEKRTISGLEQTSSAYSTSVVWANAPKQIGVTKDYRFNYRKIFEGIISGERATGKTHTALASEGCMNPMAQAVEWSAVAVGAESQKAQSSSGK